ncbi:hypothetical protein INS49_004455 [Diaporthe citri]|uniref:uncharacterized protein n=1 Tax=Diaporthe citri TaxID=83186 RepID=UPI001C7F80F7|nr:uncharacterized protein INS49_004455 [Diaporthe citri]KAG6354438.1 hypothetical protein INS49_004455 [Diaporthe citri]
MAAAKCKLDMVRQLVRTGADHGIVDSAFGESVLYSAVGHEHEPSGREIIEYLVEEVSVDDNARGGKWIYPLLRVVGEQPDLDAQGHEEDRESQYYSQTAAGRNRGKMHDPEHTYTDLDEYEKEIRGGSPVSADQSEYGGETGSENEERDEDDSESEEEEEDDSE